MKQTTISEVSQRIAQSVDESLSKQQKEFFLRQQLAAIQRELANLNRSNPTSTTNNTDGKQSSELDNDEQAEVEDMADIRAKIEAMAQGSEERKMAVREWRRLKRIPPGSVEQGVVRNYVCTFCLLFRFVSSDYYSAGMARIRPMACVRE